MSQQHLPSPTNDPSDVGFELDNLDFDHMLDESFAISIDPADLPDCIAADFAAPHSAAQPGQPLENDSSPVYESGLDAEIDIFSSNFPSIGQVYQQQAADESLSAPSRLHIPSNKIVPQSLATVTQGEDFHSYLDGPNFLSVEVPHQQQASEEQPTRSPPTQDYDDADGTDDSDEAEPTACPKCEPEHIRVDDVNRPTDTSIARTLSITDFSEASQGPRYDVFHTSQPFQDDDILLWMSQSNPAGGYEFPNIWLDQASQTVQEPPAVQDAQDAQDSNLFSLIPQITPNQLQFTNRAQAQQASVNRNLLNDWQSPDKDGSIPRNADHRAFYVRLLLHAFKDISQCIDFVGGNSFREHWETLKDGKSIYTVEQMETVCWQLVAIAESLHTRGPSSLGIYDESKLKNAYECRNLTFAQRITHLCKLLQMSKARCETLLKFEGMHIFVATPMQLIRQTRGNKKQNDGRKNMLATGREANCGDSAASPDSDDESLGQQDGDNSPS